MTERKAFENLEKQRPAGKHKCERCHDTNKAGEYFYLSFIDYKRYCADCQTVVEDEAKAKKKASYAAGEEPEGTDEITCPWCGEEMGDSWEMPDYETVICDECGKSYKYQRQVIVSYDSQRIEGGTDQ